MFHRATLHLASNLLEIITNERALERLQTFFFAKTLGATSLCWTGKSERASHVPLTEIAKNDEPLDLVNKVNEQECN